MELENTQSVLLLQRILGQVLFYPPNVAGWPGGKSWIDSSTLMARLRIPQMLNDQDELNIRPKDDDDLMMQQEGGVEVRKRAGQFGKPLKAKMRWEEYTKNYEGISRENLLASISTNLLSTNSAPGADMIKAYADSRSRESFIKTATLHLMSTPEYQMC